VPALCAGKANTLIRKGIVQRWPIPSNTGAVGVKVYVPVLGLAVGAILKLAPAQLPVPIAVAQVTPAAAVGEHPTT
jgi:hypothetical protein